jgi:hypothetical protein
MWIDFKGRGVGVSVAAGEGVEVVMDMYEVVCSHRNGNCTRGNRGRLDGWLTILRNSRNRTPIKAQ